MLIVCEAMDADEDDQKSKLNMFLHAYKRLDVHTLCDSNQTQKNPLLFICNS